MLHGCHVRVPVPDTRPAWHVGWHAGNPMDSSGRTSTGTWYPKGADDVIAKIENRVAQVSMIPVGTHGWARSYSWNKHVFGTVVA